MPKAAIFNPYWDTLGGGEKYAAAAAMLLRDQGYQVELYWHSSDIIPALEARYGFDLSHIHINPQGFSAFNTGHLWQRFLLTRQLDVFFYISDGSLPFLFSRLNLIHFQVPFTRIRKNRLITFLKNQLIHAIICNSKFTQQYINSQLPAPSCVIYPPVAQIPAAQKLPVILSVGRFDNLLHHKRQDVMIQAFRSMKPKGWRLVLAGGLLGQKAQLKKIAQMAHGSRIDLVINPDWYTMSTLFSQASIYWHAAGFGTDIDHHPEKAEHFGIAAAEAMSAGAVPVVFNGGGLPEIVTHQLNGYVWDEPSQLVHLTQQLIDHPQKRRRLGQKAQQRSRDFNLQVFNHDFAKIIG